jgi:hypothetical protein
MLKLSLDHAILAFRSKYVENIPFFCMIFNFITLHTPKDVCFTLIEVTDCSEMAFPGFYYCLNNFI